MVFFQSILSVLDISTFWEDDLEGPICFLKGHGHRNQETPSLADFCPHELEGQCPAVYQESSAPFRGNLAGLQWEKIRDGSGSVNETRAASDG